MDSEYALIGRMHMACTEIRNAIAVLENGAHPEPLPKGESTLERLTKAMQILSEVRERIGADNGTRRQG